MLDNPFVSRSHFQIDYRNDEYFIADLGSRNGTKVNNEPLKLEEEFLLKDGDKISLSSGEIKLVFRYIGEGTLTVAPSTVRSSSPDSPSLVYVDTASKEVWIKGEKLTPPLAPKEFMVLALLEEHQGKVVDKDNIAITAWAERPDGDVGDHEIEQCIRRLRRRIDDIHWIGNNHRKSAYFPSCSFLENYS